MNEIFSKLYGQLNPRQKEAVDTLEGPVMVVAGPGTGKTRVLTLRIANILLQNQANPHEVLALTFTESGVAAMRQRLFEILGPLSYKVPIHTFHGFCNELIRENPDAFPRFFEKTPIDEISQLQLMDEVIKRGAFRLIKPFGDNFLYSIPLLRFFSQMKREGVGPEKFQKLVEEDERGFNSIEDLYYETGPHKGKMKGAYKAWEKNIAKNKEVAVAYAEYQKKLAQQGYDYDDMILSALEALEQNEPFLLQVSEQYQYILTDEHQDTNQAQNKVLELLCSDKENPNIFVVGDEKQSIYRFQGANIANFLYFHSRFPNAKIISLQENYRSTQAILDAAGSMIEENTLKLSHTLQGIDERLYARAGHKEKKIRVYELPSSDHEYYFIARKIRALLRLGVQAKEIAVLYRENKDALPLQEMFEKIDVPCRVESDDDLLAHEDTRAIEKVFRAVCAFGSDEELVAALHAPFLNIPPLDIYKLISSSRGSLYDLIRSARSMRRIGILKALRLTRLYAQLCAWRGRIHLRSAPQLFEDIARESGFIAYLLRKNDALECVQRASSFMRLARRLCVGKREYSLKEFVEHLKLIRARGLSVKEKKPLIAQNAVRLMTAHGSKGLEFDYVFLLGVHYGHWGKRRARELIKPPLFLLARDSKRFNETDKEEDERRLFYVALTRARKGVYISYSLLGLEGREQLPSQFIQEIASQHRKEGNSLAYTAKIEKRPEIFFASRKAARLPEDELAFLRDTFIKKGLSPTALNNYLQCPWRYFYNNLLRIPRAKSKHEMYGTAIHAALKELFDKKKSNVSEALVCFKRALECEPMSAHDFKEALERGRETLTRYYENYKNSWQVNTINEFGVQNVFLDDLRLTGKIDKIELFDGEVNVVDYKTGKRKTKNALEGKTKNATGNEKRQLVFYKLLLDRCGTYDIPHLDVGYRKSHISRFVMISGEIDFVEPDRNTGKFYKERLIISAQDVQELADSIRQVSSEILNFTFWDKRCGDKKCEYCPLREMMAKRTPL